MRERKFADELLHAGYVSLYRAAGRLAWRFFKHCVATVIAGKESD